jgi:hypothetical protein
MTYYPDLSPYTYDSSDREMLNVGWLSRDYPFTIESTPPNLVSALVELAHEPVNVQRGMHFCELCRDFQTATGSTSRGDLFIGSGEIHITRRKGITYASPVMIVHYVAQHGYLPPADYCTAVLTSA